jgi:hypothetical protein
MRYWQPSGAKTIVTYSLPHSETEYRRSVNCVSPCIFYFQGITQIFEYITELLPTLIGKNTLYQRKITDSKLIHIANCKTCKNISSVVEYVIVWRYYAESAKRRARYESIDRPAKCHANDPPNSHWLGDIHRTIPELKVQDYWQPWYLIWQWFSFETDPDPKWMFTTVANSVTNLSTWQIGIIQKTPEKPIPWIVTVLGL